MTYRGQQMNKRYIIISFIFCSMTLTNVHAANSLLSPTQFPKTESDLTFLERARNASDGYKPFINTSAYVQIDIQDIEYANAVIAQAESERQNDLQNLSREQYCNKYPRDTELCPPQPAGTSQTITDTETTQPIVGTSQTITDTEITDTETTQPIASTTQRDDQFGKTCTPPQHSNFFPNKIFTTGRYEQSDPAFEKALITLFRVEGDYNPNDVGSPSKYGIRQESNPDIDIANLTRADVEEIAHERYYANYAINTLPDNSRGNVFLQTYNGGPGAIKRFRRFLKLTEKPIKIDNNVVTAVLNYPDDIHQKYLDYELEFYKRLAREPIRNNNGDVQYDQNGQIKTYAIYLDGWEKRVQLLRENGCHTETTNPIYRDKH